MDHILGDHRLWEVLGCHGQRSWVHHVHEKVLHGLERARRDPVGVARHAEVEHNRPHRVLRSLGHSHNHHNHSRPDAGRNSGCIAEVGARNRRGTGAVEEVAGAALRNLLGRPYRFYAGVRLQVRRPVTLFSFCLLGPSAASSTSRPLAKAEDYLSAPKGWCYMNIGVTRDSPICSLSGMLG